MVRQHQPLLLEHFSCSVDYLTALNKLYTCLVIEGVHLVSVQLKEGKNNSRLAIVRRLPCELNSSCTSTTAESRAKIWYQ